MTRDWSKLDELILYISERCAGDPLFGKTKLNKLLFYADFLAYLRLGRTITGEEYVKQPFGPVPCHLDKRLKRMAGKDLEVVERTFHGRKQHRVVPKREAQLELFSAPEISVVAEVLAQFDGFSGSDVSDLSHRFLGWRVAAIGEPIPLEVALCSPGAVTQEKVEVAEELLGLAGTVRAS
ncbi:MAG: hypothetical protein AMXMBFR81_15300 [Chthonomonas sp.]